MTTERNQLALDALDKMYNGNGQQKYIAANAKAFCRHYETVKAALTAQTVTDDEVRENVAELLREPKYWARRDKMAKDGEWYQVCYYEEPDVVSPVVVSGHATQDDADEAAEKLNVETLIRAATAPAPREVVEALKLFCQAYDVHLAHGTPLKELVTPTQAIFANSILARLVGKAGN